MPYEPKQLGYARTVVDVGRAMGVTVRGIKIALVAALVETNLWNYANRAVPASLTVPYDRIGSDSKSVGIMQQQPQWWGDGSGTDLMVPATAARLFYDQLLTLDYNGSRSPGSYAQAVQRSSFPTRYDERFAEASALYDLIAGSPAPSTPAPVGGTAVVDYGVTHTILAGTNGDRSRDYYVGLHTQEGGTGDAIGLAQFCKGAGVSYNDAVDDVNTVRMVPPGGAPWAAVAANDAGYHLVFAGSYVSWSRNRWLSKDASDGLDEDAMLWRGARAAAAACRQFNIPARWVGNNGATGWPPARGICGHKDFGARGGGHTDPYPNFPIDEFIRRVNSFLTPVVIPNLIDAEAKVAQSWIGKRITGADTPATTDDETPLYRDGKKVGAFARFERGHVYWRMGANAAYAIPAGGLFEAYAARDWERGLGFPLLRHQVVTTPGGVTAGVQSFERGVLFTPVGGPVAGFLVHGEIGKRYAAMDWEKGPLGLPTGEETPVPNTDGLIEQQFQFGKITYVPTGVLVELTTKG